MWLNPAILMAQMEGGEAGGGAGGAIILIVYLALVVLWIAGGWKTFAKAGKPGWAFIVPIYNVIIYLEITGRPLWWIILFLIPIVGAIVYIVVLIDMAARFGKGAGFGLGLTFLPFIFFPILGFGDAQYQGA